MKLKKQLCKLKEIRNCILTVHLKVEFPVGVIIRNTVNKR